MKIYADNAATTRVSDTALAAHDAPAFRRSTAILPAFIRRDSGAAEKLAAAGRSLHGTCM